MHRSNLYRAQPLQSHTDIKCNGVICNDHQRGAFRMLWIWKHEIFNSGCWLDFFRKDKSFPSNFLAQGYLVIIIKYPHRAPPLPAWCMAHSHWPLSCFLSAINIQRYILMGADMTSARAQFMLTQMFSNNFIFCLQHSPTTTPHWATFSCSVWPQSRLSSISEMSILDSSH